MLKITNITEPEDETWRAKFLLKETMDFDAMEHKCQSNQVRPSFSQTVRLLLLLLFLIYF
jgi:hypothetical protein